MPYTQRDPSTRAPPLPQNACATHSSGQTYQELKLECQQKETLFEDCDFPASDSSLFYSEKPPVSFVWKRPGEIVKDPQFILGGATRTDICQGDLGDCWLLAAIASLTLNEKVLARVVPLNQDFGPGYAGIFHFQFWQYNEWLDVVIDDRLPTFRDRLVFLHSADLNEFWSALMEKAYAKLNGSYEALKGGSSIEAMEDFTGGVGETFEVKKAPKNFYELLQRALKRGSMVGCSIDISNAAESEARTPTGLIKGHAYSVTDIDEVNYQGQTVRLIRVRNPWGQVEWNGAWSDNSSEWDSLSPSEKQQLHHTALDDGEFWMKFEDFLSHFDKVEICNLTPDALEDNAAHKWEVSIHQGSWVRGATAGGCRNFIETFWTNPQFMLQLTEKDEDQDECTFVAALMQKNRRKLRQLGAALLTIGYVIYEVFLRRTPFSKLGLSRCAEIPSPRTFLKCAGWRKLIYNVWKDRFLKTGFMFYREMDGNVNIDLPEVPEPTQPQEETEEEKQFRDLFKQISGPASQLIKMIDLIRILDSLLAECMLFIGNGKLEFNEFKIFWDNLKKWISLYLHFDSDQCGTMSSHELRLALKAAGFQLNNHLLQLIVLRYADDQQQIEFDDFLNCLIRLENASRVFQALCVENRDFINLQINEFICLSMNI
ncbi:calpain-9 [Protobothrops mucrosquamatus]|uniref:calpain-9 n=1 Tax=Protobothrops mucrosquamatus TaxID=103944 RepID=UPI000775ABEF|nr:calpain-9 [Protobothrops mucrosquamatus]